MNLLENCILSLENDDVKAFRLFIERIKGAEKCLILFDALRKKKDNFTVKKLLYENKNDNAYHSLRKSLTRILEEFFAHRQIIADESHPIRELAMGTFFIQNHNYAAASKFFERTSKIAEKRRDYQLLDTLYRSMMEYAVQLQLNTNELIEKWQHNTEQLRIEQELLIAQTLVKQRLQHARTHGMILDPDIITRDIFKSIRLNEKAQLNPDFMLKLVEMIRSAIVSSKEYSRFEAFLNRVYNRLVQAEAFAKSDSARARFYYLLAHTAYRNRKFATSEQYLEKLKTDYGLHPRAMQLKAANASYMGKNEESITLLTQLLSKETKKLALEDICNIRLNLAVYHFQSADYRKALQQMLKLPQEEITIERKLGKEWRLKKNMIELIIHCELGNIDIALARIQSIEKSLNSLFEQPMYKRALIFLKLIRYTLEYPERIATPEFEAMVTQANLALPEQREDTQAMTFYCWLKSKMINKPYYQVLVETIHENN